MTTEMNVLDVIKSRSSPKEFSEAPPAPDALRNALEAAVAAPDHGRLHPWRFILIEGAARKAFGDVLVEALRRRKPDASDGELAREAAKPLRSPVVIAVAAKLVQRPGVPEIEQILAVGAAVQNLSLALHAQGYATAWKTGEPAYDPMVKVALGLQSGDAIVGFIYVGTPVSAMPVRPRSSSDDVVSVWSGPVRPGIDASVAAVANT